MKFCTPFPTSLNATRGCALSGGSTQGAPGSVAILVPTPTLVAKIVERVSECIRTPTRRIGSWTVCDGTVRSFPAVASQSDGFEQPTEQPSVCNAVDGTGRRRT